MATASPLGRNAAQDQTAVEIGADQGCHRDQIAVLGDFPARFWTSWHAR